MNAKRRSRPTYPVDLLVEGRRFLVVGGGKVALRKTKGLLAAGADVTVVAPEVRDEVERLAAEGRIRCVRRPFEDADADDMLLVFAATDDRGVNRRVLDGCRRRNVLCCPVDRNWTEGDFVTPAVVRKGGLTVSVSTGGRSARRSRLVRDNLERHLRMAETADLLVMGTDHACLPLAEREPYHLAGEGMERAGRMLMQVLGVHEFMLLNTCNRIELVAVVSEDPGTDALLKRILGFDRLAEGGWYVRRGFEAFTHLAAVTAGLRSQSPGEEHVVAQVKEALEAAERAGWAGGVMRGWLGSAFHLARDIRAAAGPLLRGGEIEDLCVERLGAAVPPSDSARVLVVGTGTVGRGLVQRLVEAGYRCDWCYHAHRPGLPEGWRGRVELCTFADLPGRLAAADAVACAAASEHVLGAEHAALLDARKKVPVFDLGIPRNVDSELSRAAPNVDLVGLDGLKAPDGGGPADVERAVALARQVVAGHREMYDKILESLQGGDQGQ